MGRRNDFTACSTVPAVRRVPKNKNPAALASLAKARVAAMAIKRAKGIAKVEYIAYVKEVMEAGFNRTVADVWTEAASVPERILGRDKDAGTDWRKLMGRTQLFQLAEDVIRGKKGRLLFDPEEALGKAVAAVNANAVATEIEQEATVVDGGEAGIEEGVPPLAEAQEASSKGLDLQSS